MHEVSGLGPERRTCGDRSREDGRPKNAALESGWSGRAADALACQTKGAIADV